MPNHPLFDHELRDEIINIFINDPYNTEGHYETNRVHAPDGSVGWPAPKSHKLEKLKSKYGTKIFTITFNVLIDSNIIIKEIINEHFVYSLSSEFITEHLVPDPFPND